MSEIQNAQRTRIVRRFTLIAGMLALALAALSFFSAPLKPVHPRTGELVFPGVLESLEAPPRIRITTADTSYTLQERPEGWGLVESGGYPVRADRMQVLADALRTLTWGDVKTRDPEKFDRIGLGDPAQDGAGALIEVVAGEDDVVASLISGRKEENIYGRRPADTDISFQLEGALPPLYTRQGWLDLDLLEIPQEVIKSVRLVRPDGESLYLSRPAGSGPRSFRPAPPNQNDQLVSRIAATGPALAITRFFPVDVKPASGLKTKWIARHITVTHDALEIDIRAYAEDDGFFVTLRAVEAGNGANRASSINARAEGWAFELAEYDWSDFAPELSSIVRRAIAED